MLFLYFTGLLLTAMICSIILAVINGTDSTVIDRGFPFSRRAFDAVNQYTGVVRSVAAIGGMLYMPLLLTFFLALALCLLLVIAASLLSLSATRDVEKGGQYECGFDPFDSAVRLPFNVHFYVVGILFIVFDVEIALLFP